MNQRGEGGRGGRGGGREGDGNTGKETRVVRASAERLSLIKMK